jgi:hypothetical protein
VSAALRAAGGQIPENLGAPLPPLDALLVTGFRFLIPHPSSLFLCGKHAGKTGTYHLVFSNPTNTLTAHGLCHDNEAEQQDRKVTNE